MPGSSLWLLPPEHHPLNVIFLRLIKRTATHFKSPHVFMPHLTLTSNISPESYGDRAGEWLRQISFPAAEDVVVKLGRLESRDLFVQKLYSKVEKEGLRQIGKVSRRRAEGVREEEEVERWVEDVYMPHVSLLYHDCPKLSPNEIAEVESMVTEAGVNLEGEGDLGGWVGGRVVLVPTDKQIALWAPIAEIAL